MKEKRFIIAKFDQLEMAEKWLNSLDIRHVLRAATDTNAYFTLVVENVARIDIDTAALDDETSDTSEIAIAEGSVQ